MSSPPKHPIRDFLIAFGIPATGYGAGFALMLAGPDWFWLGVYLAIIAGISLGVAGWALSGGQKVGVRIVGPGIGVLAVALILWLAFYPAPIRVEMTPHPGGYQEGTGIAGIKWKSNFSEFDFAINNDTDMEYKDIDVLLRTDLYITKVGTIEGVNECSGRAGTVDFNAIATGTYSNSAPVALRFTNDYFKISTFYRIHCDVLAPKSSATVVFAIVKEEDETYGNASWGAASVRYIGGNRWRDEFIAKCFTAECPKAPNSVAAMQQIENKLITIPQVAPPPPNSQIPSITH